MCHTFINIHVYDALYVLLICIYRYTHFLCLCTYNYVHVCIFVTISRWPFRTLAILTSSHLFPLQKDSYKDCIFQETRAKIREFFYHFLTTRIRLKTQIFEYKVFYSIFYNIFFSLLSFHYQMLIGYHFFRMTFSEFQIHSFYTRFFSLEFWPGKSSRASDTKFRVSSKRSIVVFNTRFILGILKELTRVKIARSNCVYRTDAEDAKIFHLKSHWLVETTEIATRKTLWEF